MRTKRLRLKLRMELNTDTERMIRPFNRFYEVLFLIYSGNNKAFVDKLLAIVIVKLISVSVTL